MRMVRDLDRAEDLAHEALAAALERWPETGIPDNPGAWLMTTAKRKAIDALRHQQVHERNLGDIVHAGATSLTLDDETVMDAAVGDDLLRLMLITCHPILPSTARVALTLRLLCNLTTEEIARAFLAGEAAIAQRIVRAKRTLAEARVPFEVPRGAALSERLDAVLEVIYLVFNEGYSATRGDDPVRPELCNDALRLGRVLARLVPEHAEAHGLVALMELHASRLRARVDAHGEAVLLLEQNRAQWDRMLIHRGLAALERAQALAQPMGPYALQAAISACHARALDAAATDWLGIVALYDALVELTGSPVVEVNRAMAVAMAYGADAGLELLDEVGDDPALRGYHWLAAARGELLWRAGRRSEARAAFLRAAADTANEAEQRQLRARADACREPDDVN